MKLLVLQRNHLVQGGRGNMPVIGEGEGTVGMK